MEMAFLKLLHWNWSSRTYSSYLQAQHSSAEQGEETLARSDLGRRKGLPLGTCDWG